MRRAALFGFLCVSAASLVGCHTTTDEFHVRTANGHADGTLTKGASSVTRNVTVDTTEEFRVCVENHALTMGTSGADAYCRSVTSVPLGQPGAFQVQSNTGVGVAMGFAQGPVFMSGGPYAVQHYGSSGGPGVGVAAGESSQIPDVTTVNIETRLRATSRLAAQTALQLCKKLPETCPKQSEKDK